MNKLRRAQKETERRLLCSTRNLEILKFISSNTQIVHIEACQRQTGSSHLWPSLLPVPNLQSVSNEGG